MFTKLKKKLEEGEPGGPERLSFSPRRLPGGAVAVRSPPADGTAPSLTNGPNVQSRSDSVDGKQGRAAEPAKEEVAGERARKERAEEQKPVDSIDLVSETEILVVSSCNLYMITSS